MKSQLNINYLLLYAILIRELECECCLSAQLFVAYFKEHDVLEMANKWPAKYNK